MSTLPCLIFDQNESLTGEHGLNDALGSTMTMAEIKIALYRALKAGDRRSFFAFCAAPYHTESEDANFMLLSIRSPQFGRLRYIFCEKNLVNEASITVVYFARRCQEFHALMSPTSALCRTATGKLMHDLFQLRHVRHSNYVTPHTLLLLDRYPLLSQTLTARDNHAVFCDLLAATEKIAALMKESMLFAKTEIEVTRGHSEISFYPDRNTVILEFSLEAYGYLAVILLNLLNALSDDHKIRVSVSYFAHGAEARFQTTSSRIGNMPNTCSNFEELVPVTSPLYGMAKTASGIAYAFDIPVDLYRRNNELTATLGIGFDSVGDPVFHYNDPYVILPDLLREIGRLSESV